ncbi:MAG: tetratricopeptide repeat protein [Duncaniella sp.]|nr:tetratricopeptide repeat protein [Duncaniella sp.]
MIRNAIVHIALLVILCSCGGNSGRDRKFDRIDTIADTEPRKALEMLDSIDYDNLSERERHRHDLLTIKARDKAYILHTSDSLIRDVVDYYSSHTSDPLYPQALYYGGRVYSDLGDYPTALQYFQDALDKIPDDDDNLALRGAAISQTGRLLDDLRLYSEAIPYVKQSIMIVKQLNDTFNIAYDYQLLSEIYIHAGKIDSASTYIKEAIKRSSTFPNADRANIRIDLAALLYEKGNIDSALQVIRPLVKSADSICRNYALAKAARIYSDAGIIDTAYIYARELAMSKNQNNRKTGFQILFSPELKNIVPKDTLLSYIPKYKQYLEDYLNTHEAHLALIQQSKYNYQSHLRDKIDAEKSKNTFLYLLILFAFFALIFAIIILILKFRKAKIVIKLHEASDKIDKLNSQLEAIADRKPVKVLTDEQKREIEELRKRTEAKVEELCKEKQPAKIPSAITDSKEYNILQEHIKGNKIIPESDNFWNDLEQVVNACSPGFSCNLQLLIGKLNKTELHLALLIKCGITPTQATIIFGKEKGTLSYHRKELGSKCLNRNTSAKLVDYIIHSL